MTTKFRDLARQEKIFQKFVKKQSVKNQNILRLAFSLAKKAHHGQLRDEGDPYFIHPLRVANCLINEFGVKNIEMVGAALLHDVVEDTDVTLIIIKKQFNPRLTALVKNLTRPRPKNESEQAKKISKIRKYKKLMRADKSTRLIKCADMLDNLRSMPFIPAGHPTKTKFPRWINEAEKYNLPLAHHTDRMIVGKMKTALKKVKKIKPTHA